MLKDGIYELHYRNAKAPDSAQETLLLALRDGNVLGSDRWGGVFLGRCVLDVASKKHKVNVRLQVPPGGVLITDAQPQAEGYTVDIALEIDGAHARAEGVVDVAGAPVWFELVYMGQVPA
jgi:hypothetical protein